MQETFNISDFNVDPFDDSPSDKAAHEEIITTAYSVLSYFMFFTESIKLFLSITVLIVDFKLALTIHRDKKKSRTKQLLMHFAVSHIFLFISSPLIYIILDFTSLLKYLKHEFYLCLVAVEQLGCVLSLFFAFGLGLEWLIICFNIAFNKFTIFLYKHLVKLCYLVAVLQFIVQFLSVVLSQKWAISHFVFRISLFTVLIFLAYCNYLFYRNKIVIQPRKTYILIIANVIALSWLPLYVFDVLLLLTAEHRLWHAVFLFFWFMPECLAFGNVLIIIYILGKYNVYYQNCFDRFCKRCADNRREEGDLNKNVDERLITSNVFV